MRGVFVSGVLVAVLSAAPVFAQAAQQPTQPAPKPATPPTTQAPATQTPAQPAQPAAQPQPPRPFPEGAKLAFVNLNEVAANSSAGKAANARLAELQKKKQAELQEKNKALQAAQQKLTSGGTVLNDSARAQLEKDIERQQREIQFAQQNAQAEMQDLTQELQGEFREKLMPIIEQVGKERALHMIFTGDAGIIWADPGLDLTQEVIKRLDARATGTPKQ